jgi:hypothetical protein
MTLHRSRRTSFFGALFVTAACTWLGSAWFGQQEADVEAYVVDTFDLSQPSDVELEDFEPDTTPAAPRSMQRSPMVISSTGSSAREEAVSHALKWIVTHQSPDGSWSFRHRHAQCPDDCSCGGTARDCRTGATALALMALQGASQTHKEGAYKRNVAAGMTFLLAQMHLTDPADGTVYRGNLGQPGLAASHALATIALCEEYGMTQDRSLLEPAQLAINEIIAQQDDASGGWTSGRGPGMALSGWNLLALKHGHMNYLVVSRMTTARAQRFFGSLSEHQSLDLAGRAIALRCRTLLGAGWKRPAAIADAEAIAKIGCSDGNLVYDFFATQVMEDYGGPERDRWDKELKNWLVSSQQKAGHDRGSWYFPADSDAAAGGRLYCTTMATLILELHDRRQPLICRRAYDEDFPL